MILLNMLVIDYSIACLVIAIYVRQNLIAISTFHFDDNIGPFPLMIKNKPLSHDSHIQ